MNPFHENVQHPIIRFSFGALSYATFSNVTILVLKSLRFKTYHRDLLIAHVIDKNNVRIYSTFSSLESIKVPVITPTAVMTSAVLPISDFLLIMEVLLTRLVLALFSAIPNNVLL